ncbi:hypothetical protein BD770DRAFT_405567 [Pilaira anomala]|nr:hypothetical protein BD770DRAFT_405567 [Pilaira anomala]
MICFLEFMKWMLKDSIFVENILVEYAKSITNENISHSFVISVKDNGLKSRFKQHRSTITGFNLKPLPAIPDDFSAHLAQISALEVCKETERTVENYKRTIEINFESVDDGSYDD